MSRAPVAQAPADRVARHRALLAPLAPGRALDVACGRGRHAFLLAALGFAVDAVDADVDALADVGDRASRTGAAVRALRLDLEREPLPAGPYAVIVDVNFLQRSLFSAFEERLAPSGLLVLETFTVAHPTMNRAYTLGEGELLRAFARLEVLDHHEGGGRAGIVARRAAAAAR